MIFLFLSSSGMLLKTHWLDMPYIKQAQRAELDWRIRNLAQAIQELSDVNKPASFCRTLELNLYKTGVALIPERHYWAIALSSRSNRMEMFTKPPLPILSNFLPSLGRILQGLLVL
jgi:hypothetical protein